MGYPSRASEFPNDNASISSGARWLSEQPIGAVAPELPPEPAPASSTVHELVASERFVLGFDDDEPYDGPPLELHLGASGPVVVVRSAERAPEPEPDATPAFRHFENALTRALMARSATRAAAVVPRLLRLQSLTPDSLSPELAASLKSHGYLDENFRYSAKFRDLWAAWSAVLSGSSNDLSACGSTTLDTFGAQLLAALLTVPGGRAEELRRELRRDGIAAFGVLEAA
ncbi:MAG: hypothetical protein EOO73_30105 [Myxococcales bacterium]|nr:MAG: hypothetical protein EOO73_30105 [Myxococcales bacterium]